MAGASKRSSFYIAAIKTVYGERPESEFFDIGVRVQLMGRLYSMGSFDIALTHSDAVADTTIPGSSSEDFSDAGTTLDYELFKLNDMRQLFAGVKIKLFDGVPYWGFHFGVIELCNSALRGTFFTGGYVQTFYHIDSTQNAQREKKLHKHNFFVEFSLMSHKADIPIIKSMRIRAGILLPAPFWNDNPEPTDNDVKTRIVIEVPIGELIYF